MTVLSGGVGGVVVGLAAGEMVHYGVEAADVAEDEVEDALRNQALHQADKVLGEGNALVPFVDLDGAECLAGHDFGILNLEEGVDAVEHAGIDEIRGDGRELHGALLAGQLDADGLGPTDGRPLGRGVEGHSRQREHAGRGGDVADVAAAAGLHVLDIAQGDEHRALGVDVDRTDDVLVGLLRERQVVGDDAGVVDEDIHVAAGGLRGLVGGLDGSGVGDVGPETDDLAERGKLRHGGPDGRFVDVPDDDLAGAFLQAPARHDFADPGASSGDQDGIALNFHGSKNTQSTRATRANVANSPWNVAKYPNTIVF